MKQLMIGNAAVARGLYEAGCGVASSYPGTPSTEITEEAAKYDEIYCEWAPNEKVALEVAFGAAVAGKRSFCGMKHVGLNVAADPLFTISYTGINHRCCGRCGYALIPERAGFKTLCDRCQGTNVRAFGFCRGTCIHKDRL